MLDAVTAQPARLNATARGRCLLARRVANRRPACAAGRAASGEGAIPCTRAWTFGETRGRAGTWAAVCPWRRPLAHGGQFNVPTDGANRGRRETAGLHDGLRAASSGTGLTGAPRRPAFRALQSALVGVQPTTLQGPRPSGPGEAAASSRTALPFTARSVVSTSEAGTDDASNATSCNAAVPVCRDNGGTTGSIAQRLPRDFGGLNSPRQDDVKSCLNPSDGANRRAAGLPVRKELIVLTACSTPRDSHPQVRATKSLFHKSSGNDFR